MEEDEILENQALGGDLDDESGGQGGVVDTQAEGGGAALGGGGEDGAAVSAGEGAQEEPDGAGRAQQRPVQTHEDNAAARAARIRAEAETAQRLQRQFDQEIAGLGVPNPYTGKPFGSFQEFQAYGKQYQQEQLAAEAKKKGTTVEALEEERENQSFLARKRQEEKDQRAAMEAAQKRRDFLAGDIQAFMGTHPDVDVAKLEANPKFRKFAGDRLYRVPLGTLYDDFVEIVGDAERAALVKAGGRAGRSTGGGQGGGMDLLTPAQRSALEEWNRENPEMRMTPKEFLQ